MGELAEIWLWIPGYEDLYQVSDLGHIRSFQPRWKLPRDLKLRKMPNGYLRVSLYRDQRRRFMPVHQAVLLAFEGSRPEGTETRHLNGDRQDNRRINLRYGTPSANALDRIQHGTHVDNRGAHHGLAKLTEQIVTEIRERCAAGELQRVVGADFGIGQQTVSGIVLRRRWKHLP